MLKENIEKQCRKICPSAELNSVCKFAPSGAVGFIDTSGARDGTRGLAFFGDSVYVNFDGVASRVEYKDIDGIQIISSFEDNFADELCVTGMGFETRISDYSLDKFELKVLLERLCRETDDASQTPEGSMAAACVHKGMNALEALLKAPAEYVKRPLPERKPAEALDDDPIPAEEHGPVIAETVIDIPEQRSAPPKDYSPAPIPEESINWLSGANREPQPEEKPEKPRHSEPVIMSGVIDRAPVLAEHNALKKEPKNPLRAFEQPPEELPEKLPENEMLERIENMSSGEMMDFLSETMGEINSVDETDEDIPSETDAPTPVSEQVSEDMRVLDTIGAPAPETAQLPKKPLTKWEHLTEEPIWGDIYIKASKGLRELCESGKLTMEQMEQELKSHLLPAAEAFEKIAGNESNVPKVMMPKITELKAAAADFDRFFGYGEDVAIRAMFFMLYQMLTYADRIAESPETKDKLNDFFRRFGSAGITLSMLDMRV